MPMDSVKPTDPLNQAQSEADHITAQGYDVFERAVQRVLFDAPWLASESLLDGLESFHQERIDKVPSATTYPESSVWVDYVLSVDRELKRLLNLDARQIAIYRSLNDFLMFRGIARSSLRQQEKCRVVYIPQTDHGQFHAKNIDDPAPPNWRPQPKPEALPHAGNLVWDGVGSGLHLDDEPDEIFPLPITTMYQHYADDVPSAVDFLTKYSKFFGGMNFVLHDRQKRSVAIEKCSRNFIEVFEPDPTSGFSHCSGMACRNPESPQASYQRAKRQEYCEKFGLPNDGPDWTFWNACHTAEEMLASGVRSMLGTPRRDDLFKHFTTPWPDGLNKPGVKLHPEQTVPEYTLITSVTLIDELIHYRWQRDEDLKYPDEPEVIEFGEQSGLSEPE